MSVKVLSDGSNTVRMKISNSSLVIRWKFDLLNNACEFVQLSNPSLYTSSGHQLFTLLLLWLGGWTVIGMNFDLIDFSSRSGWKRRYIPWHPLYILKHNNIFFENYIDLLVTGSALTSDSIDCSRGKIGIFKCFESFSISTGRTSSQSTSRSSSRVKLVTPYNFFLELYLQICMSHSVWLISITQFSKSMSKKFLCQQFHKVQYYQTISYRYYSWLQVHETLFLFLHLFPLRKSYYPQSRPLNKISRLEKLAKISPVCGLFSPLRLNSDNRSMIASSRLSTYHRMAFLLSNCNIG